MMPRDVVRERHAWIALTAVLATSLAWMTLVCGVVLAAVPARHGSPFAGAPARAQP